MRIIHPQNPETAAPPPPATLLETFDAGRVDTLEKIVSTLLQRLQSVEERIKALESEPAARPEISEVPAPSPAPSASIVTFDSDAMKKNLLDKMWKYLNDQAAA